MKLDKRQVSTSNGSAIQIVVDIGKRKPAKDIVRRKSGVDGLVQECLNSKIILNFCKMQ